MKDNQERILECLRIIDKNMCIILFCLLFAAIHYNGNALQAKIVVKEPDSNESICHKNIGKSSCNNAIISFSKDNPTDTSSLPEWLFSLALINDYIDMIGDTSLYSLTNIARRHPLSSTIPQQRRGVDYARKVEARLYGYSSTATITKDDRYYDLSAEDMKRIQKLYETWWGNIIHCKNVVEMRNLFSKHPLDGSPYKWQDDSNSFNNKINGIN